MMNQAGRKRFPARLLLKTERKGRRMEKIRMAVIGIGTMGKKICENDTGGKDFRDVSWGSLLQGAMKAVSGQKRSLAESFLSFRTQRSCLMPSELFDACLIVTPHKLHPEMIIQAFDKGKHIFCDKPIGVSMGQCLKIRQKAEEKDLVLQ